MPRGRSRGVLPGAAQNYTCRQCGKTLSSSSALQNHDRVHSGVKPFECDICGKVFSQRSSLSVHKQTHSGLRPHVCGVCRKRFYQSSDLKRHMQSHLKHVSHANNANGALQNSFNNTTEKIELSQNGQRVLSTTSPVSSSHFPHLQNQQDNTVDQKSSIMHGSLMSIAQNQISNHQVSATPPKMNPIDLRTEILRQNGDLRSEPITVSPPPVPKRAKSSDMQTFQSPIRSLSLHASKSNSYDDGNHQNERNDEDSNGYQSNSHLLENHDFRHNTLDSQLTDFGQLVNLDVSQLQLAQFQAAQAAVAKSNLANLHPQMKQEHEDVTVTSQYHQLQPSTSSSRHRVTSSSSSGNVMTSSVDATSSITSSDAQDRMTSSNCGGVMTSSNGGAMTSSNGGLMMSSGISNAQWLDRFSATLAASKPQVPRSQPSFEPVKKEDLLLPLSSRGSSVMQPSTSASNFDPPMTSLPDCVTSLGQSYQQPARGSAFVQLTQQFENAAAAAQQNMRSPGAAAGQNSGSSPVDFTRMPPGGGGGKPAASLSAPPSASSATAVPGAPGFTSITDSLAQQIALHSPAAATASNGMMQSEQAQEFNNRSHSMVSRPSPGYQSGGSMNNGGQQMKHSPHMYLTSPQGQHPPPHQMTRSSRPSSMSPTDNSPGVGPLRIAAADSPAPPPQSSDSSANASPAASSAKMQDSLQQPPPLNAVSINPSLSSSYNIYLSNPNHVNGAGGNNTGASNATLYVDLNNLAAVAIAMPAAVVPNVLGQSSNRGGGIHTQNIATNGYLIPHDNSRGGGGIHIQSQNGQLIGVNNSGSTNNLIGHIALNSYPTAAAAGQMTAANHGPGRGGQVSQNGGSVQSLGSIQQQQLVHTSGAGSTHQVSPPEVFLPITFQPSSSAHHQQQQQQQQQMTQQQQHQQRDMTSSMQTMTPNRQAASINDQHLAYRTPPPDYRNYDRPIYIQNIQHVPGNDTSPGEETRSPNHIAATSQNSSDYRMPLPELSQKLLSYDLDDQGSQNSSLEGESRVAQILYGISESVNEEFNMGCNSVQTQANSSQHTQISPSDKQSPLQYLELDVSSNRKPVSHIIQSGDTSSPEDDVRMSATNENSDSFSNSNGSSHFEASDSQNMRASEPDGRRFLPPRFMGKNNMY